MIETFMLKNNASMLEFINVWMSSFMNRLNKKGDKIPTC